MMQQANAPLSIEINGLQYIGFTDASISTSMLNVTGEFTLTATSLNKDTYPIKRGDKCRVLLYNEPIITGFVNTITPSVDTKSNTISISGRDKTCDIDDCTLSGGIVLNAPISLIDITHKVLNELGITDIQVKCDVDLKPFQAGELVNCEIGDTAFSFLNKYARKRQVLLTTDGSGNILYVRTGTNLSKTMNTVLCKSKQLQFQPNIVTSSASYDDSKRFYKYVIHAQCNTSNAGNIDDFGDMPPEQETYITATAIDDQVRATRVYNFMSDVAYINSSDLQERVNWQANNRKYDAFKYTASVQGFIAAQDNIIWRPNTLVNVIDDSAGIFDTLLIASVKFDYSINGSSTTLEMVDASSFSLEPVSPSKKDKEKKNDGKIYNYV